MGTLRQFLLYASLGMMFASAAAAQSQPPTQTPPAQTQAQTQQQAAQPQSQQQSAGQATNPTTEQAAMAPSQPTTVDQVVDHVLEREHQEVATLRHFSPIIETYIQDMRFDQTLGVVPEKDHYFLGQADLAKGVVDDSLLPSGSKGWKKLNPMKAMSSWMGNSYVPAGFLQMIFVDPVYFDKKQIGRAHV